MEGDYYIKLRHVEGRFDGAFVTKKEFDLSIFKCEIIYKTFYKIPINKKLLFEFKNGNGGEDRILSQAAQYQENSKFLLNGEEFFHIIVIRSKKLKKSLINKKEQIIKKNFVNFAILSLDDKYEICGIPFEKREKKQNNEKKIEKNVLKQSEGSDIIKTDNNLYPGIIEQLLSQNELILNKLDAMEKDIRMLKEKVKI